MIDGDARRWIRPLVVAAVLLVIVGVVASFRVGRDAVPWTPHPVAALPLVQQRGPLRDPAIDSPLQVSPVPAVAIAARQNYLVPTVLGSQKDRTIHPGQTIAFTVRLSNPTDTEIRLDPCPVYEIVTFGRGHEPVQDGRWYRLPCERTSPRIRAGGHLDFDMQASIGKNCCGAEWLLWGGRAVDVNACTRDVQHANRGFCPELR